MRVENIAIPVTVLRCDYSKDAHTNYLFTIFHRLNTGGTKLTNQEIRNCIYSGPFNEMLHSLDQTKSWRVINKMAPNNKYRFRKQEIILRFFAFYHEHDQYNGQLAKFLNSYMKRNRFAKKDTILTLSNLFKTTSDIVYEKIFDKRKPSTLPTTVIEALFVGVAHNIDAVVAANSQQVKDQYRILQNHEEFSASKLAEGLAKTKRVKKRLEVAINLFSQI